MYSLHHLWMKTYLQMKRLVTQHAVSLGLSPGQPKIIEFLAEYGEHEQKDIASYCEIEPATVGNILLRMENAGLIRRRNKPNNRRSLYVSLTPKGEEVALVLRDVFNNAEAQITAELSDEEKHMLINLLSKCLREEKAN